MALSEREYIELCKKLLEEKFSFGNGHGFTQKDLELLSNYMEEKNGVYISLSTLKRLWKNSFKQGPQLATLNALVNVLDYENWQDFKLRNKKNTNPIPESHSESIAQKGKNTSVNRKLLWILLIIVFIITAVWYSIKSFEITNLKSKNKISIKGPIVFEADKTISKGVPNTVIFNYDVSNVVADSFFIQQSWNAWRKERIDPNKNVSTSIYFESGFHRAKLIANDQIIAKQPIHILSDGWEAHTYYDESDVRFIAFKGESFIEKGQLHLSEELLLKKNIDTTKYFKTRISNSQVFNISSNNFVFNTRVKLDPIFDTICPWFIVLIVTEEYIFKVKIMLKGCEVYADYILGEIYRGGKDNDLSLLGQDVFEWQEIGVKVKNKRAEIIINGKSAFIENYKKDFGMIVGITYIFEGKGSVDYVNLSDIKGNTVFEDDFKNELMP